MTDELGLNLKTTGKRLIEEVNYGVYLWQMPDGAYVADDEGNFFMIRAMRGDKIRQQRLADGVKEFHITEGKPVFFAGHRPVTNEEYEEQKQRLRWGLTPDIYDIASVREDQENAHKRS